MDGFDLGYDQIGFFVGNQVAQRRRVKHVQRVRTMRDLHGGRVGVAVGGDHLDPETLQLDGDFLAQLTRAKQQDTAGGGGQRRAQGDGRLVGHGGDSEGGEAAIVAAVAASP